jgi:hypothetical protein
LEGEEEEDDDDDETTTTTTPRTAPSARAAKSGLGRSGLLASRPRRLQ